MAGEERDSHYQKFHPGACRAITYRVFAARACGLALSAAAVVSSTLPGPGREDYISRGIGKVGLAIAHPVLAFGRHMLRDAGNEKVCENPGAAIVFPR